MQALIQDNRVNSLTLHSFLWVLAFGVAFAAPVAVRAENTVSSTISPIVVQKKETRSGSYLAGRFARSQGDIAGAHRYLDDALEVDPQNNELVLQAFRIALLAGRIEDATKFADILSQRGGTGPVVDHFRLTRAIDAKDWETAQAIMDAATKEGFSAVLNPLIAAWLGLEQGVITSPLDIENTTEEPGNFAPFVYYQLALINDLGGFDDTAEEYYARSLENVARLPYRIVEAFGNFYERHAEKAKARELYEAYRESNPGSIIATGSFEEDAVALQTSNGKPERLVATSAQGIAEIFFSFASIIYSDDHNNNSLMYLRLSLDLRPDFPAAQFMLATLLEQNKEFAEAEKIYRSIDAKSVFYRKGLLRIALNDDEQGKTDRALAMLDTLQKDDDDGYTALLTRAEILRNHERFDEAIAAYSTALEKMQKVENYYWPIIYARGICYERVGKWELAEKDFKQALTLEPDQPDVLNYLGYSWLVMGKNISEAKDMISRAIEQRPNDPHIIDSMGWALFGMGDFTGAVTYLERALNLAPEDATVNEHLGDAYWRSNRKVEARYQWERALVYDLTPEAAEAVRAKIQKGLPPVVQIKQADRQSKSMPSSSGVLTLPAKQ